MQRLTDNYRSPLALMLFFGTTLLGLGIDLWTKALAVANLSSRSPYVLLPGWLEFTYTSNQGAVFGLGQGQRWLFIAVSIGAIAFLTYLFTVSGDRRFYQFLLGLLLAGVLGNMFDRICYGYVRDMIHALPDRHWPDWIRNILPGTWANGGLFPWIFNVADSLLCVGVFLMIVYSLIHRPPEAPQLTPQPNADERR